MKLRIFLSLSAGIMAFLFSGVAYGQFDDVYYNPDEDDQYYATTTSSQSNYDDESYDSYYYDDVSYDHFDDYDYYYSSRIRRFHRPYRGFGFYDPCYVDLGYYDPFAFGHNSWFPGTSIYISFGSPWNSWNRYNRWNRHSYWGDPFMRYYAYNPWYSPGFGWNHYNYGYYGYNSYNYYGYNNYYHGYGSTPVANVYNVYNSGYSGNPKGIQYGPRTTGTTKTSPRGLDNDRVVRDVSKDGVNSAGQADPSGKGVSSNAGDARTPVPGDSGVRNGVRATEGVRTAPADREVTRGETPGAENPVRQDVPAYRSPERERTSRDINRRPVAPDRTEPADRAIRRETPPSRERQPQTAPPRRDNTPGERNYDSQRKSPERRSYTPSRRPSSDDRMQRRNNTSRSRSIDRGNTSRSNRSFNSGSSRSSRSSGSFNSGSSRSSRSSSGNNRSSGSRRGGGE